jgi:3-methylcrotonyl-CoA carboxylase alpha subunit
MTMGSNFMPDVGPLLHLRVPEDPAPGGIVRYETGVRQGDQVSVFYDPMIAKLVVHGKDRTEALRIMRKALGEYEIAGLHTNIDFLKRLASHPAFIDAEVETGFIQKYHGDLFPVKTPASPKVLALAALESVLADAPKHNTTSPWASNVGWRPSGFLKRTVTLIDGDLGKATVTVTYLPNHRFNLDIVDSGGKSHQLVNCWGTIDHNNRFNGEIGNQRVQTTVYRDHDSVYVFDDYKIKLSLPVASFLEATEVSGGASSVKTPMPCKITGVFTEPGKHVAKGETLIVLEAMKMEHVIKAPHAGIIDKVFYKLGDLVGEGKVLVSFTETEE